MLKIVEKQKDFIIVYKPPGIPSQPDPTGDTDAMTLAGELLRESGESGDLWLVHRLDRVVGGLLVFARNKRTAGTLGTAAAGDGMRKEYFAVTESRPEGGVYTDFIYKDARVAKSFIVDSERRGVKRAELECTPLRTVEGRTLNRIKLNTGRYHQIRAQLSYRGYPIVGDGKYGSRDKGAHTPALFAFSIEFTHAGKRVRVEYMPDTAQYPWSLFETCDYRR